jgi:hypothetical protein
MKTSNAQTASSTPKWMSGDYFLLDAATYHQAADRLQVRFRNADSVEIPTAELWRNRPGRPDWQRVRIDPETHGAILVPTEPGHPTTEGETAEIPGDMIRLAADSNYRKYVDSLAKS